METKADYLGSAGWKMSETPLTESHEFTVEDRRYTVHWMFIGRLTTCTMVIDDGKTKLRCYFGGTVCSTQDTYNKYEGMKWALYRALKIGSNPYYRRWQKGERDFRAIYDQFRNWVHEQRIAEALQDYEAKHADSKLTDVVIPPFLVRIK